MKKVLVTGTFDLLHPGHLRLFDDAKKYGEYLIVVVARDVNVERIKGIKPKYNEKERLKHVAELPIVDKAVLGSKNDWYKTIEAEKPDTICLGYDQQIDEAKLKFDLEERGISPRIVRLSAYKPHIYKSSKLKEKLNKK